MQSTLILLISVLGWGTAHLDKKLICPKTRDELFLNWADNDDTVVLYDKNGEICLTARFSMYVIIDGDNFIDGNGDGFIEVQRKEMPEMLHVETKNFKGICAGEVANLWEGNVSGPALLFAWNETRMMNHVLIQWEVQQGKTFLKEIKINLTVPRANRQNRYLSAKLSDLHLFPTEVGKPVFVNAEEINVYFRDSSKGCLKFKEADYTISETFSGLSVVTVVVLAIVLGMLMALGVMFYNKGSRKKLAEGLQLQI